MIHHIPHRELVMLLQMNFMAGMAAVVQQFSLDFSGKLPVSAQLGMQKADENADERWKHVWDGCVLAAARKKSEITSDDVLAELEQLKNRTKLPETHNLSAIGPAMKRAWKMGILKPTERTVRSKIAHKNGNLHVVWISNYYTPEVHA